MTVKENCTSNKVFSSTVFFEHCSLHISVNEHSIRKGRCIILDRSLIICDLSVYVHNNYILYLIIYNLKFKEVSAFFFPSLNSIMLKHDFNFFFTENSFTVEI